MTKRAIRVAGRNFVKGDRLDLGTLTFAAEFQVTLLAKCLSRGALRATFVDARLDAVRLIRENLALTGLADRAEVLTADYASVLSAAGEKYDLIFLDPPYETKLLERSLELISQFDILREHGIIVCESPMEKNLPELSSPYAKHREYRYGKIKVTIYRRD